MALTISQRETALGSLNFPWNQRSEKLSTGNTYHFVDHSPNKPNGKTLLLLHGFPDTSRGWRNQIGPFHEAGYRIIAPDMIGYGGTNKPNEPEHYTPKSISEDLAALLDLLDIEKVTVVGHDWGSFMAGRFALWKAERIEKVVLLSVPYIPPSLVYAPLEAIVMLVPTFGYQLYLADENSTPVVESQLDEFLKLMYQDFASTSPPPFDFSPKGVLESVLKGSMATPTSAPIVLNQTEFDYYKSTLSSGKMTGPLNYYRTTHLRYKEELELAATFAHISAPTLWMGGDNDPVASMVTVEAMRLFIPDLEISWLKSTGHWVLAEEGNAVAKKVLEFVGA
ncbi:Alpha/Beta hydrolase protein [Flagelloscypha sp. PMI_526]|nr:Alpha/Beta hydrolase protein [Flagelloscypha sp. PMI_526]